MNDKIKCPSCGNKFDVEEALSGQLEAQFKAKYEKNVAEQAEKFIAKERVLENEREAFQLKKEKENEIFKEKLQQKITQESIRIDKENTEKYEQQMKALELINEKKTLENRELKAKEIALKTKEKELEEKQEDLKLELQRQMLEKQSEIEEKARMKERELMAMREKEFQKQLEDQKKLIEEMKRKAEQGSMQLQGEVQELALENLLKTSYPFDNIDEVAKGTRGADCIQTVVNANQQECGSIVYESKRTKTFGGDWINKLKQDQVASKSDIAVLVTEVLPKDMDRFGEKNGVWVCTYSEVKSLSFVLRQMLIKMQTIKGNNENKSEKMELLYRFLTGTEFSQNINRIVENYDAMINQLNTEKKRTYKSWAEREKQIWSVQENLSSLFGSIKGIAGNAFMPNNQLELQGPEED